jgi:hypothetical protein
VYFKKQGRYAKKPKTKKKKEKKRQKEQSKKNHRPQQESTYAETKKVFRDVS